VYRLRLERGADKAIAQLSGELKQRVATAIAGLRENPRPAGCIRLRGEVTAYRIRIGSYRVLYEIDDGAQVVTVWRVGLRKDVYSIS
jgi:mRNA interferase RelE/StbE